MPRNQLPSLLWNSFEFLWGGGGLARVSARDPSGLCARVRGRLAQWAGRLAGVLSPCLYRFPHSRVGLLSLRSVAQWGWGRSTRQARPTGFPHPCPQLFLISASLGLRRLEQAHMGHHKSRGWGQQEGQCVSPLVSSRECNAALTFLRGCPRDLIKEGGKLAGSWLGLQG